MALVQIADIIAASGDNEQVIKKIKTEVVGPDQYIGYTSFQDAADSTEEWVVAKLSAVGGNEILEFAGGTPEQRFTWADRLAHTYS